MSEPWVQDRDPVSPQTNVEAKIVVGNVDKTDNDALYDDPDPRDETVWADYMVMTEYVGDPQTFMLPYAKEEGLNGDTVAFIKLANDTAKLVVDWTASRLATQPEMPAQTSNPDWKLLSKKYEPAMIVVGPDGQTPIYRISGTYVYGHRKPGSDLLSQVQYPLAPWLATNVIDRTQPTRTQSDDIAEIPATLTRTA